jgi:hypothetical protein
MIYGPLAQAIEDLVRFERSTPQSTTAEGKAERRRKAQKFWDIVSRETDNLLKENADGRIAED